MFQIIFNNVTVVSPHGLPYSKPSKRLPSMFFPYSGYLSYRHMEQHALRTYVNLSHGVMTTIDRKNKYIGKRPVPRRPCLTKETVLLQS